MIPKYILKEVLFYKEKHKDQTEITRFVPNKNYIEYTSEVTGNPYNYITHDKINIYELMHMCKEWASKHHYSVMSGWEMTHWGGAYRVAVFRNSDNILFSMSTVKTEPEAIFRACEWIFNNKVIK